MPQSERGPMAAFEMLYEGLARLQDGKEHCLLRV